jgi:hypothetical protein
VLIVLPAITARLSGRKLKKGKKESSSESVERQYEPFLKIFKSRAKSQ